VGQPQAAVSALEKAAALAPNDAQIARRLGAALAATHDFERAVACYETARKTREENAIRARSAPRRGRRERTERPDSGKPSESIHRDVDETALDMQMELAELYKRLRRWDDAEDALARVAETRGGGKSAGERDDDLTFLGGSVSLASSRRDVRAFKLLCGLKAARGDQDGYVDALLRLKAAQEALVKTAASLGGEDKRTLAEHKKALAETCVEAAGAVRLLPRFRERAAFFRRSVAARPRERGRDGTGGWFETERARGR
jgi:tetratricopeptide (TPR) repeat protein